VIWSVFGGVHTFFQSTAWSVVRLVGAAFVVVLWGATVFWVWKDAKRRIENDALKWIATVLGAVPPFLGPLVYMLFRPPEYLEDVRERELEIKAIEQRLGAQACPVCRAEVSDEFLVCPVCTTKLRQACSSCSRPLEQSWQICPYCETPIAAEDGAVALIPRPAPRRSSLKPG
jgi:RNA polymerase subunit RPABC4/transcription elongation factor Spt4